MTILEKDNYKICSIYQLGKGELDTKQGLAIEKKCSNGESWYVICFIKYNENECAAEIECIGTRLLDIEDENFSRVKSLIFAAVDLVEAANK